MLFSRVYMEDTDFNGIVYYPNYLKFFERARTEHLRSIGLEQNALFTNFGYRFVVKSAEIDYKKPLKMDQRFSVTSEIVKITPVRIIFKQTIGAQDHKVIHADACFTIAVIGCSDKPVRLEQEIVEKMKQNPVLVSTKETC